MADLLPYVTPPPVGAQMIQPSPSPVAAVTPQAYDPAQQLDFDDVESEGGAFETPDSSEASEGTEYAGAGTPAPLQQQAALASYSPDAAARQLSIGRFGAANAAAPCGPQLFLQPVARQKCEVPPGGPETPAPCARFGHTAVVHEDTMVIYGGRHYSCLGDVWIFHFTHRCWRQVAEGAPVAPCARAGHTAAVHGDRMFVFGGVSNRDNSSWLDDIWALDLRTYQWTPITPAGPAPCGRKGHTAVVTGDSMFVFGGGQDDTTLHNDLWEFCFRTLSWRERQLSGPVPHARMYHVAVVAPGDRMLVFGGRAQTERGFLNDVVEVQLAPGAAPCPVVQHDTTGVPPSHRMCSTAIYHNHTLAVFTGGSFSYLDDSYQLDLQKMHWEPISDVTFGGRTRPTTVKWRNTIATFGGCVHVNGYVNDLVEIELEPMSLKQTLRRFLLENNITDRQGLPSSLVTYVDG